MVHTITLKELRPELPKVVENIDSKLDSYIVTRRGKPVVVVMSIDEYKGLLATIELLSDAPAVKRIRKSQKEIKAGRYISREESRKRIEGV